MFYRLFQYYCRAVSFVYFQKEVYGKSHLTKRGGGILVANHQSFLDPPFAGDPWPRPIWFLARSTLFKGGFLKWFFGQCQAIPVRRGEGDIKAVRRIIELIKGGNIVLLFPEGTRSRDGRLQPGRIGTGLIAHRARARIYPCYVEGSGRRWPRGWFWARPGKVRVFYGRSFLPDELYRKPASKHVYEEISRLMMAHVAKLEKKSMRFTHSRRRARKASFPR